MPVSPILERSVDDKPAIRAWCRAFREGLTEAEHERRSREIIERVSNLPELERARTIHLYWPHIERREVNTRPLIEMLSREGRRVILPVVTRFARPGERLEPRLSHCLYTGETVLAPNRWGLHEPVARKTVPFEEIDLVLVPALAADRRGHRVGYGMGYYDEFLAHLKVPTICAVYQECLFDRIQSSEHDIPVSIVVTEEEVVRPDPS